MRKFRAPNVVPNVAVPLRLYLGVSFVRPTITGQVSCSSASWPKSVQTRPGRGGRAGPTGAWAGPGRGRGPRAWAGPGGRLRAAAGRRATSSRGGEPGSPSSREKGWLGPRRVDEARPSSAGPVRGNKAHLGVVASVFVLNFQRQGTFFSGGSNSCIKWIFISMYLVLNQGFSMSQRVLSKVP